MVLQAIHKNNEIAVEFLLHINYNYFIDRNSGDRMNGFLNRENRRKWPWSKLLQGKREKERQSIF